MQKVIVIGLGEVGKPLYEIIKEKGGYEVYGYDINKNKIPSNQGQLPEECDIMHICYPCNEQNEFIDTTISYIKKHRPELTIINSTIPPTTTYKIYEKTKVDIVHSPVRGIHKTMKRDLLFWTKYIGGVNEKSVKKARDHFNSLGIKTKVLNSPIETELAKLLNTTYRSLLITWFQEIHRISRVYKADFLEILDFIADTHKVRLDRPILYPDHIGGHCLIPNTELLIKSYNSIFLKAILESNNNRREEIKDEDIRREIEKVKELITRLTDEIKT